VPGYDATTVRLEQKTTDDITILALDGELDAFNLPTVSEKVDALIDAGSTKLVVNLHLLTFINSSALGWLLETRERLDELAGDLVIAEPSEFFERAAVSLGIDRIFEIYTVEDEAVRHFEEAGRGGP